MTFLPGVGNTGPLTGPLVLGYMIGCILVGILTMQVYSYYNNFPNDRSALKWLVGILFGLEILFTLFTLIDAWVAFGTGWGDVATLEVYHWSLVPLPVLSGIIASIVQYFFAYRIYKLTKRMWIPILIAAISALQCVMVLYVGIANAVRGRSFTAFYQLSTFVTIWLAGDAVCDILIAICTVTILVRAMRESHFRNTDTTLRRLIRLTVETGLITASGATVELILWQVEKFLNYHYIFFLILGKLYSNALMAALNSRFQNTSGSSDGRMSGDASINTRHQLTLFEDEIRDRRHRASQAVRVAVGRSVDVSHDLVHEMKVVTKEQPYGGGIVRTPSPKFGDSDV